MAKNKYTPERVARLVKNPGTRASVPTKYLPAKYRKQRELNARLDSPVTEGSSLTNRMAARERNAAVDLRYGPLEQQLNQQVQQSQRVQQAIPQWYQQYRDLLNAAQSGVAQGYQAAVQQFQGLQAGTQAQQGQQQLAGYQQEAARLGQTADPQATQIAAQAAAQRAAMAGNLGSVLAAQGANQNAYGQNLTANTGAHQIESILGELQNERDIRSNQAQLAREKGAFSVQTDQGIRDRERKSVLENAAFNLDVANTQADNARADEQLAETKRQNRAARRRQEQQDEFSGPGAKYGYTNKEWANMTTAQRQKAVRDFRSNGNGNGNGPKPATAQDRREANTEISRALNVARAAFNAAKQNHAPRPSRQAVMQLLVNGRQSKTKFDEKEYRRLVNSGMSPVDARRQATSKVSAVRGTQKLWADIAADIAYDGHVSRRNAQLLHDSGLTVRDLGLPSYTDYTARRRRISRPPNAPGANGQRRPT